MVVSEDQQPLVAQDTMALAKHGPQFRGEILRRCVLHFLVMPR
jgi:hypothetical protein